MLKDFVSGGRALSHCSLVTNEVTCGDAPARKMRTLPEDSRRSGVHPAPGLLPKIRHGLIGQLRMQ
jgi:hypothetical protein